MLSRNLSSTVNCYQLCQQYVSSADQPPRKTREKKNMIDEKKGPNLWSCFKWGKTFLTKAKDNRANPPKVSARECTTLVYCEVIGTDNKYKETRREFTY